MYSYDRTAETKQVASGEEDAKKILALFKKNFKYVSVRGHGSSRDVVLEFTIEGGLFNRSVVDFAAALGVDPKSVTLKALQP